MKENLQQLRDCLQILALPVTAQIRLLPGDQDAVAALARSFDDVSLVVRYELDEQLTAEQAAALGLVRLCFCQLLQQQTEPLAWSDTALRNSHGWRQVRKSARSALLAFGWTLNPPPAANPHRQGNGDRHHVPGQEIRYSYDLLHQGPREARPKVV